jgi:hypothetical protein
MRITAFRIPKPKRFEYRPRFYDPDKEMREERNRRILRELENEDQSSDGHYTRMEKGDIRHYISFGRRRRSRAHRGSILLRIITVILALFVAILIFYGTFVLVKLV